MNASTDNDDVERTVTGLVRANVWSVIRWPVFGALGGVVLNVARFVWEVASQRGRAIQSDPSFDAEEFFTFALIGGGLGLAFVILRTNVVRQSIASLTNRWRKIPDDTPRRTILLLWCLLCAAVVAIGVGAIEAFKARQLTLWQEAPATVLRSNVDTLEPNHAVVSVEYEYQAEGTTHQGQDFHVYEARRRDQWALHFARTFANNTINRNAPGGSIVVFYDPHHPMSSRISKPELGNSIVAASAYLAPFVLVLSAWGLWFRRFAFGTCWIAITLIIASVLAGAPVYYSMEWARTAHSDGAGFAVVGAAIVAFVLFFVTTIGSSIAYGMYWRRRFRSASVAEKPDDIATSLDIRSQE